MDTVSILYRVMLVVSDDQNVEAWVNLAASLSPHRAKFICVAW
jgi:hypothetical protein